ncbi:aminotransferase class IV [Rhodobacter maris]|uniref:Probable branched-chain-amino-acid aminotransferase n=1 Tax=Rhodobacter maris TaxID=446682 RepID=A0A285S5W7_9RHOB|nr:aminotransferase class IV [Rhodobacter maris]SOC02739.1 4-amino-4-deoxychorismate lyase [Rhodobacter maris]
MGGSAEQGRLRARAPAGLQLIETMRWVPGLGVELLLGHMARLEAGCAALEIQCDLWRVEQMIDAVRGEEPLRLRLTVGLDGTADLTQAPLPDPKPMWRVGLAQARVDATDPFRQIKSTERALYDGTRADLPKGWDEAVFLNEKDELVEGTISTVFLWADNALLTPPLSSGALPGVLRADLIRAGRAREARLSFADIMDARIYMGNALRGLIPAVVI